MGVFNEMKRKSEIKSSFWQNLMVSFIHCSWNVLKRVKIWSRRNTRTVECSWIRISAVNRPTSLLWNKQTMIANEVLKRKSSRQEEECFFLWTSSLAFYFKYSAMLFNLLWKLRISFIKPVMGYPLLKHHGDECINLFSRSLNKSLETAHMETNRALCDLEDSKKQYEAEISAKNFDLDDLKKRWVVFIFLDINPYIMYYKSAKQNVLNQLVRNWSKTRLIRHASKICRITRVVESRCNG